MAKAWSAQRSRGRRCDARAPAPPACAPAARGRARRGRAARTWCAWAGCRGVHRDRGAHRHRRVAGQRRAAASGAVFGRGAEPHAHALAQRGEAPGRSSCGSSAGASAHRTSPRGRHPPMAAAGALDRVHRLVGAVAAALSMSSPRPGQRVAMPIDIVTGPSPSRRSDRRSACGAAVRRASARSAAVELVRAIEPHRELVAAEPGDEVGRAHACCAAARR